MNNHDSEFQLAPLFRAVEQALVDNRELFNQADLVNANHGDHMVEVFNVAAQAAQEKQDDGIAAAMELAATRLAALKDNGSAQVYQSGLGQLAVQLRRYKVELYDLVGYVCSVLGEKQGTAEQDGQTKRADVLKALLAGLAGWQQVEKGKAPSENPLDMGYLFDLGIAYMQAKQRGGTKAHIIAEAAASVSPLADHPQRLASGRLAIETLLEAM